MNIHTITRSILQNYDEQTANFISLLNSIQCDLIYNTYSLQDCIINRHVYSCSIRFKLKGNKFKKLHAVWPILIGSRLDVAIRKMNRTEFKTLQGIPNLLESDHEWATADIAVTCFVINGMLKQIPFFITNDTSNAHIYNKNIVRIYRYDSNEKGTQLSLYFHDTDSFKQGDLVLKRASGEIQRLNSDEEIFPQINEFFDSPHSVQTKVYFQKIYADGFKIDNIDNKIVISPGHLFYKLFRKTLYVALKERDYKKILKSHLIVKKCIETGDLYHILSKKTVFYKETNLKHKMVNTQTEIPRSVNQNGTIFMEKRTTCYRDANTQFFPYLPYLSHFAQLVLSEKVKTPQVLAFNDSYIGFLCLYGTTESKNIGRQMMLARDCFISTQQNLHDLYTFLKLEEGFDKHYAVINGACIEITRLCWERIDCWLLKRQFVYIECYRQNEFLYINYKVGLLFKQLESDLWVTSKDIHYWIKIRYAFEDIAQLLMHKGHDFLTSYSADLIRYHRHNAFHRNILTLNTLKNAVLSNTSEYSVFFFETISAYTLRTPEHQPLLQPANILSEKYVMYIPKLNVLYSSFMGSTQEDCIVMNSKVKAFDAYRFYTVKIKFKHNTNKYFHPTRGPSNPGVSKSFLGTIVSPRQKIEILSQTMHLQLQYVQNNILKIYFTKPHFEVLKWHVSDKILLVCIQAFHPCSVGDKLCSLHGQKGVLRLFDSLPRSLHIQPDLIINAYGILSRQTLGQIMESKDLGGRDYDQWFNSDGKAVEGSGFTGMVTYFSVSFWSSEHMYVAKHCAKDKITDMPLRGRSRKGGMASGNMEMKNNFQGNGIASCFEEKILQDSDRIIFQEIPLPKSVLLCQDDAKFFKCNLTFQTTPVLNN